jgi:AmiR/NasT family two-component response regulator
MAGEATHLRVLIANDEPDPLGMLTAVVADLGHEPIVPKVPVEHPGAVLMAQEHPDVVLVGLGSGSDQALDLISEVVREAACPVIALLSSPDPDYVNEAAIRGAFAYIVGRDAEALRSALAIALRRFAEYQNLQYAFGRRAEIEQAKGILMARHGIDQTRAFEMLREHSQRTDRKLIDVAEAVIQSHALLLTPQPEPITASREPD